MNVAKMKSGLQQQFCPDMLAGGLTLVEIYMSNDLSGHLLRVIREGEAPAEPLIETVRQEAHPQFWVLSFQLSAETIESQTEN